MKHLREGLVCQVCNIDAPDHTDSMIKACRVEFQTELKLGKDSRYNVYGLFVAKQFQENVKN